MLLASCGIEQDGSVYFCEPMHIYIVMSDERRLTVRVKATDTIKTVKEKIAEHMRAATPPNYVLVNNGNQLTGDMVLLANGITERMCLQMMEVPPPPAVGEYLPTTLRSSSGVPPPPVYRAGRDIDA